jgi:hypothetical protein
MGLAIKKPISPFFKIHLVIALFQLIPSCQITKIFTENRALSHQCHGKNNSKLHVPLWPKSDIQQPLKVQSAP